MPSLQMVIMAALARLRNAKPNAIIKSVLKAGFKKDNNLSYIDKKTFEKHYVSVPEQGGGNLIPEDLCNPGQATTWHI